MYTSSSRADSGECSDNAAGCKGSAFIGTPTAAFRLLALAAVMFWAVTGCVVTAECDDTVRCEGGRVCYDRECRPVCQEQSDCVDPTFVCMPCQQDDATGSVNHCDEDEIALSACVPEEDL